MSKTIIAYYRVSTKKQYDSGLGLDAQRSAVEQYATSTGATILRAYEETESGKNKVRPELLKAIAHCRRSRAVLVIAKLDRLARNVSFLSALMDSGIEFICCDNPHANRLTIHILAAVAEDEARRISDRTKDALAAYKARGGRLGAARPECRKLTDAARLRGAVNGGRAVALAATESYSDLAPMMREWRESGAALHVIADRLNDQGHTTRRGCSWSAMQVSRVLTRFA